ncbi:hypothetical protein B0H15DRAFT_788716, partial [Mycena belliarum]
PGPGRVSGFAGLLSSASCYRIGDLPVGPVTSVADFHAQPFCTVSTRGFSAWSRPARPGNTSRLHLTRGGVLPHNILTDRAYRPAGLIDWECAGWLAE